MSIIIIENKEREVFKMMSTLREELLTRMIRVYGFEHPLTLMYGDLLERLDDTTENDEYLVFLVESHEHYPCDYLDDLYEIGENR